MSSRQRINASPVGSGDTAIAKIDDRAARIQCPLLELAYRSDLPARRFAPRMLVGKARIGLKDVAYPIRIAGRVRRRAPHSARFQPESRQIGERWCHQPP